MKIRALLMISILFGALILAPTGIMFPAGADAKPRCESCE